MSPTIRARYVVAGAGAFPNGGRNSLPLHPINNVDFSLLKRFNFTESVRFEFGSQFFNVFNHPQVTGGYLSDVSLNSVATARNELIPGDPQFGNFDKFYSNNARQLQLVARVVFLSQHSWARRLLTAPALSSLNEQSQICLEQDERLGF